MSLARLISCFEDGSLEHGLGDDCVVWQSPRASNVFAGYQATRPKVIGDFWRYHHIVLSIGWTEGWHMAEHRISPRLTVDLPVRVWGMNAEGRTFSQHARAQNISAQGALIIGIDCELKVGEVIGVQCEESKARCTIMWIMSSGTMAKKQVGIRLLAGQECPWKNYLNLKVTTERIVQSQKRRWLRHKVAFPLEIRDERSNSPARVNASDVSGNGCYVENMLPFPLGTILRMEFHIDGSEKITLSAIVRTCDPGVGNGIEFTGLTPEVKQRVQSYLDRIDPPRGPQLGSSAGL